MNPSASFSAALLAGLLALPSAALASADTPRTPLDAIAQGKPSLTARARYEGVQQTGLRDADALTLRTRLGYTTAAWEGWRASLEFENVASPYPDRYNQAGLNPGGAGRAVVPDPTGTEVNQAWLSWGADGLTLTGGRQRLVLDNARFVGDVAWRQNLQTFDALVASYKSLPDFALTYAYLDRINRVFGDRHPQGRWSSRSHLAHASYSGFAAGTFAAYAYLLDFAPPAAAQSCATFGASFAGNTPLTDELKLAYRAELATQRDHGRSPLDYSATYALGELGLTAKPGALALGYELLGSDAGRTAVRTPLATLHAFNGWADVFLATPNAGLRETFVRTSANLPHGIGFLGFYRWFSTDRGSTRLGTELDLQLTRKFGKHFNALVKFADFDRSIPTLPNVRKIWAQLDYTY